MYVAKQHWERNFPKNENYVLLKAILFVSILCKLYVCLCIFPQHNVENGIYQRENFLSFAAVWPVFRQYGLRINCCWQQRTHIQSTMCTFNAQFAKKVRQRETATKKTALWLTKKFTQIAIRIYSAHTLKSCGALRFWRRKREGDEHKTKS